MNEFGGTGRFVIEQRLGAGAVGVVYRAFDCERQAVVALKTLRNADPRGLALLKQEFRSLADVRHPNLVRLHELLADGTSCFFTMELVDGAHFDRYVLLREDEALPGPGPAPAARPDPAGGSRAGPPPRSGPRVPPGRLRSALSQLCEGLVALHRHGKLHRDIKPANVLVSPSGRVVVLDFGLAKDLRAPEDGPTDHVGGTPVYMAPEQARGEAVAASDWYSVGVMLYRILTGELPFDGPAWNVALAKQRSEPRPPSALVAGVPPDLDGLCRDLLRLDPAARPTGPEVLVRLGSSAVPRAATVPAPGPFLVGRAAQLAALLDAFEATRRGSLVVVRLHGASGLGKTSLLRHFAEQLKSVDPRAVVLSGRCFEQEAVPYKALDGLVDGLGRYLARLDPSETERVLPRDTGALAQLFPALLASVARAGPGAGGPLASDPRELRQRALVALRGLLGRLSERRPLVLCADDLQWGDLDSALVLETLLRRPGAPALLLVASYRSEEVGTSTFLRAFLPGLSSAVEAREVVVGPLLPEDACQLALALAGPALSAADALACARESGGSPFFLGELVRGLAGTSAPGEEPRNRSLAELIRERAGRLPAAARRLLETICVAGSPIDLRVALHAAAVPDHDREAVELLRSEHLSRTRGEGQGQQVEPYHDRIREALLEGLPDPGRQERHRALSAAMESVGEVDPERLAWHLLGGGEVARASACVQYAAEKAFAALAFDRAARLYERVLVLRPGPCDGTSDLRARLAAALANAGRGAAAADAFLSAADAEPERARRLELRRRASEQLLSSGRIGTGLEVARGVLASVGLRLPRTRGGTIASLLFWRSLVEVRGLRFVPRDEKAVRPEDLLRVDACWAVSRGLGLVDMALGAACHVRHLWIALRVGEPYRVARVLCLELLYGSSESLRGRERTRRRMGACRELVESVGDAHPHAVGLHGLATGLVAFIEGHWDEAQDALERAEEIMAARCTDVAWELGMARMYALSSAFWAGRLSYVARRLPGLVAEARQRDDLFAETLLCAWHGAAVALAAGDPAGARRQTELALERWSHPTFHLQHYLARWWQVEVHLYLGEAEPAWERAQELWDAVVASLLYRNQRNRLVTRHLRARAALALAALLPDEEARPLVRVALDDAAAIRREHLGWGDAFASLLVAGVATFDRPPAEAAGPMREAVRALEASGVLLLASAARRRCGDLLGGPGGAALTGAADAWMAGEGVEAPERTAAMLVPGRFPGQAPLSSPVTPRRPARRRRG